MAKQWTKAQEDKLRKLCFEGKSNADLANIFNCELKDIHATRSRLGITIDKVKDAKAAEAQKVAPSKKPTGEKAVPASKFTPKKANPKEATQVAFDALDLVLINAAAVDKGNAQSYRAAAAGVSTIKSLLIGALK